MMRFMRNESNEVIHIYTDGDYPWFLPDYTRLHAREDMFESWGCMASAENLGFGKSTFAKTAAIIGHPRRLFCSEAEFQHTLDDVRFTRIG